MDQKGMDGERGWTEAALEFLAARLWLRAGADEPIALGGIGEDCVVGCLLGGGAGFAAGLEGPGLGLLVGSGAAGAFHDGLRGRERIDGVRDGVRVLLLVFAPLETVDDDRMGGAAKSGWAKSGWAKSGWEWKPWSSVPVFLVIDGGGGPRPAGGADVELLARAASLLVEADRVAGFSALPWDSSARIREVVLDGDRVHIGALQLDPSAFSGWDEIEPRELDLVGGMDPGDSLHRHLEEALKRSSSDDVALDGLDAPTGPVGWWMLSERLMQGLVSTGDWFDRDAIAHFFGTRTDEAVLGDTDDAIRGIEAFQEWFHFMHRPFDGAPTAAEAAIAAGDLPDFAVRALAARANAEIHVVRVAHVEPGAAFEVLDGGRGEALLVIDPRLSTAVVPGDWLALRLFRLGGGAFGRQMSPTVIDPERLFAALAEIGAEVGRDSVVRGAERIGELWGQLAAADLQDRSPDGRERVLVSACLLGRTCTYRGDSNADGALARDLERHGLVPVPFCPEESGGLPTPRAPADLSAPASDVLDGQGAVRTDRGVDVTREFLRGAERALTVCRTKGIRRAYLKERSPSCGCASTYVRGELVEGAGVTTALLRRHGIRCEGVEGRRAGDDMPAGAGRS